jgi:hypothetical protein
MFRPVPFATALQRNKCPSPSRLLIMSLFFLLHKSQGKAKWKIRDFLYKSVCSTRIGVIRVNAYSGLGNECEYLPKENVNRLFGWRITGWLRHIRFNVNIAFA